MDWNLQIWKDQVDKHGHSSYMQRVKEHYNQKVDKFWSFVRPEEANPHWAEPGEEFRNQKAEQDRPHPADALYSTDRGLNGASSSFIDIIF